VNAHVGIDGLTALRRIDPEDAALSTALCALLRAAGMTVRIVEPDGLMFETESGISFSVGSINGRVPVFSVKRVTEAVAALDAIDPLLVDVETALGISLDATGMGAGDASAVGIQIDRDDFSITLVTLREHPRRADWLARAAALPPSASHLPVTASLVIVGPRLTVIEASELSAGDLLLIPQKAATTLYTPHLPALTGAFDLSTGQFSTGQTGATMPDETLSPDFLVPLTIQLPDRMTSAASLAALVPGATLALGPLTEGMPVELCVAGRLLGRGELVQLGDCFAVLIEDRADIQDMAMMAEGD
jgi:flagellar motor switch/type III secretory pathway protein FliN